MEKIKLLFAGDFCIRYGGIDQLYDEKIRELSAPVKAVTDKHDISVVNVETVFTDNPAPTKKSGPNIYSPIKAIELLKAYGFDIGAFANNHTMDQGETEGIASFEKVKETGMKCIGFGKNLSEANKPCRIDVNGKTVSILNFAENEFVPATIDSPGFAPVDYINNSRLVRKEKEDCDYVFVFLHAGCEICPFPRKGVIDYCRAIIDDGADGVVISHPHCPQGIEYINGKPIVYSVGNFFMPKKNDRRDTWTLGYLASIEISDDGIKAVPIPYEFGHDGAFFRILDGEEKEKYIEYINTLSDVITKTPEKEYEKLLCGWSDLFVQEAKEGYLDDFLTLPEYHDDLMLYFRNGLSCESHSETWLRYFKLLTENKLGTFDEYIEKIQRLRKRPIE